MFSCLLNIIDSETSESVVNNAMGDVLTRSYLLLRSVEIKRRKSLLEFVFFSRFIFIYSEASVQSYWKLNFHINDSAYSADDSSS